MKKKLHAASICVQGGYEPKNEYIWEQLLITEKEVE